MQGYAVFRNCHGGSGLEVMLRGELDEFLRDRLGRRSATERWLRVLLLLLLLGRLLLVLLLLLLLQHHRRRLQGQKRLHHVRRLGLARHVVQGGA